MAFDFIKKVFSFGRKPEEAKPAETVVEPTPVVLPEPPVAVEEAATLPEPLGQLAAETAPEPVDEVVEPTPTPVEPAAEIQPAAPTGEILPPIRVPEPIPSDPILDDIAPEPPQIPAEPTVDPVEAPPSSDPATRDHLLPDGEKEPPAEVASDTVAESASAETVADLLSPPGRGQGEGAVEPPPTAEILPPIRVPEPTPVEPLIAEIAPEPVVIPTPVPAPEPAPAPAAPVPPPVVTPPPAKVLVTKKVEAKAEPVAAPVAPRPSWFQRMREGLSRSSRELSSNIAGVFTKKKLDEETLQDLEDVLIRADLGVETALRVTDTLASTRLGRDISDAEVRAVMAQEVEKVLTPVALPLELDLSHKPHVILVVGVNGTGKTTTIGKLAAKLTSGGLNVMLAAGDTFRAAAIEQLKIWGERTNSPVIATKLGADAAGLAYDAFEKAREAKSDVLIIDTAGRLQNKAELMAELEKIVRVLSKLDPEAPHTVLQTVDATTGQNALNQVEIFRNIAGVNGLVMTKLDGTARGGILVAIAAKHKLPVYFIGVGEQVDDLEPFSASEFARAIAGVN
jgi:fused signal recognition particle receptor